ncbi:MAG: HAD family phosphatase [Clostridia bacterium]|nr:HAD family phosphatase [Clostridia bacterium]
MKTYLFDFDGTLVDSMPAYASMMLGILAEHHVPHEPDIIKITTPLGYPGTAKLFIRMGLDMPEAELLGVMNARAVKAYTDEIPAKAHVIDALRRLKARGDSLNVLTASPHAMLDPCLKRLGIYDWFDHVWSCDDFGTTKADPQIYHMAAQAIGCDVGDVWFLDDNLGANTTAKAAGMRVCGVYDDSSAEYTQEIRAASDAYIEDFSQIGVIDRYDEAHGRA